MAIRFLLTVVLAVGMMGCQAQQDAPAAEDQSADAQDVVAYTALTDASHDEIQAAIQTSGASYTIVNRWATWCAPCVKEFPYFIEVDAHFEDQGVDVVFVSTDFEEQKPAVEAFLEEQGWEQTSFFKTSRDNEFVNAFSPKWSGALPATFIYDGDGSLVDFWEGEILRDELFERVEALLAS